MFYSQPFYNFVSFLLGLMLLSIPLTAQYSNDSIPALLFGVFYLYLVFKRFLGELKLPAIIRLIVHIIYMVLSIRAAYTSFLNIIATKQVISYIDFVLALIAGLVFGFKVLKIFIRYFDDIIRILY